MAITNTPLPLTSSLLQLEPQSGKPLPGYVMSKEWAIALQDTIQPIGTSVQIYPVVALTAQSAAIGTTPIPLPAIPAGLYRLTYYARITTPGSISSSLAITFLWTDDTVSMSSSFTALTGNTITTGGSGSIMIAADAATAISYSTAYASNAAGMAYKLSILIEAL